MAGAQPRPAGRPGDRRALLARVHIARKEMALDEIAYRALLLRVMGQESAADATDAQLTRVLAEMTRLGWKPKSGRRLSQRPDIRMIHAIWTDIRRLICDGSLDFDADQALRTFVARQTKSQKNPAGITSPEWLRGADVTKVIEGLKGWRARLLAAKREPADG